MKEGFEVTGTSNRPITRRSMMGRLGLAALGGAVAPWVLDACSSGPSSSATKKGSLPADKNKNLVFWHTYTAEGRANAIKRTAKRFEAAHPGVTVDIQVGTLPEFNKKWPAAQRAGALPDVLTLQPGNAVTMWLAGALYPADAVYQKLGGESAFLKGLPERTGLYQGTMLCVPHYCHERLFYHRSDLLDAAGVTISDSPTWDETLSVAQKLTKAPHQYGWQLTLDKTDTGGGYLLNMIARSAGGQVLDGKTGESQLLSPEVMRAAEFIIEIGRTASGKGEVNYTLDDNYNIFISGATALSVDTPALAAHVNLQDPKIDKYVETSFLPKDKQPGSQLGDESLAFPKGNNPHLGQEFAEFLYTDENYTDFLHSSALMSFPVLKSYQGEKFYDEPTVKLFKKTAEQAFAGINADAQIPGFDGGVNPYAGPFFDSHVVENAFQAVLVGGQSLSSAMKTANSQVQGVLNDTKSRLP